MMCRSVSKFNKYLHLRTFEDLKSYETVTILQYLAYADYFMFIVNDFGCMILNLAIVYFNSPEPIDMVVNMAALDFISDLDEEIYENIFS